jgi:hypothetical protein
MTGTQAARRDPVARPPQEPRGAGGVTRRPAPPARLVRPGVMISVAAAILAVSGSVLFWGSAGPVLNRGSATTVPAPLPLGSAQAPEARVPAGAASVTPPASVVANVPEQPAGGSPGGPATSGSPTPTAPPETAPSPTTVPEPALGEAVSPSDSPATTGPTDPADLGPVRGDSSGVDGGLAATTR